VLRSLQMMVMVKDKDMLKRCVLKSFTHPCTRLHKGCKIREQMQQPLRYAALFHSLTHTYNHSHTSEFMTHTITHTLASS
jgi:hypothetical protein